MTQWLGGTSQLRVFHVQLLGTLCEAYDAPRELVFCTQL